MTDLAVLFAEYERALLASPVVARFTVLKRRIIERAGFMRVRAELTNGGLLEFSEFWNTEDNDETTLRKYTYHWQTAGGQLMRRWDNAPHHPELPHAPHHVHPGDEAPEGNLQPPTLQTVLAEIEAKLSSANNNDIVATD
jgi:hypothetical protein